MNYNYIFHLLSKFILNLTQTKINSKLIYNILISQIHYATTKNFKNAI